MNRLLQRVGFCVGVALLGATVAQSSSITTLASVNCGFGFNSTSQNGQQITCGSITQPGIEANATATASLYSVSVEAGSGSSVLNGPPGGAEATAVVNYSVNLAGYVPGNALFANVFSSWFSSFGQQSSFSLSFGGHSVLVPLGNNMVPLGTQVPFSTMIYMSADATTAAGFLAAEFDMGTLTVTGLVQETEPGVFSPVGISMVPEPSWLFPIGALLVAIGARNRRRGCSECRKGI
ncbi:MAG: hypothetical protein WBW33_01015 [Bryobacteraceae bacterium]